MLMRQWVDKLNQASEAYYNGKGELMSDYEWDRRRNMSSLPCRLPRRRVWLNW